MRPSSHPDSATRAVWPLSGYFSEPEFPYCANQDNKPRGQAAVRISDVGVKHVSLYLDCVGPQGAIGHHSSKTSYQGHESAKSVFRGHTEGGTLSPKRSGGAFTGGGHARRTNLHKRSRE